MSIDLNKVGKTLANADWDKIAKGAKIGLDGAKLVSDLHRENKAHKLVQQRMAWEREKFYAILEQFHTIFIVIVILGAGTGGFFLVKTIFFGKTPTGVEASTVAVEDTSGIVEKTESLVNDKQAVDTSESETIVKKGFFQSIGGFFKSIGRFFKGIFQSIGRFFKNVGRFFKSVFQSIGRFFKGVFQGIGKFFKGIFQSIGKFFKSVFRGIGGFFKGIFQRGNADVVEKTGKVLSYPILDIAYGWRSA